MEADAVRRRLHPEGVVTYTIDGRINYTDSANPAGFEPIARGSPTSSPQAAQA